MLQTAQPWEQFGQSFLYDIVSKTTCRGFKSFCPCHVEVKFTLVRLFLCKKVIRPFPSFSFFTKSHARFCCSVVNALSTLHFRYQLFVSFISFQKGRMDLKPKRVFAIKKTVQRTVFEQKGAHRVPKGFAFGSISSRDA